MNDLVHEEPGYLIHSTPYRESSLILSVFSLNHGVIQMVANGARRRKSTLKSTLQLFKPLLLGWRGKGDLKTLSSADVASSFYLGALPSGGMAFCCGLYINELLTRLMPRGMPSEELFAGYVSAMGELFSGDAIEKTLRKFEWMFLDELGGLPDFDYDKNTGAAIMPESYYQLNESEGFVRCHKDDPDAHAGAHLIAMKDYNFEDIETLKTAKKIHRLLIDQLLCGKPLNSREMIRKLLEYKK